MIFSLYLPYSITGYFFIFSWKNQPTQVCCFIFTCSCVDNWYKECELNATVHVYVVLIIYLPHMTLIYLNVTTFTLFFLNSVILWVWLIPPSTALFSVKMRTVETSLHADVSNTDTVKFHFLSKVQTSAGLVRKQFLSLCAKIGIYVKPVFTSK